MWLYALMLAVEEGDYEWFNYYGACGVEVGDFEYVCDILGLNSEFVRRWAFWPERWAKADTQRRLIAWSTDGKLGLGRPR